MSDVIDLTKADYINQRLDLKLNNDQLNELQNIILSNEFSNTTFQYHWIWNKKFNPSLNFDTFKSKFYENSKIKTINSVDSYFQKYEEYANKIFSDLMIPSKYLKDELYKSEYYGKWEKGIPSKNELCDNQNKILDKVKELPKKYKNFINSVLKYELNKFLYSIEFLNNILQITKIDCDNKKYVNVFPYIGLDSFYEEYSIYIENNNAIIKYPKEIEEAMNQYAVAFSDKECKKIYLKFLQTRICKLCKTLPLKYYDFIIEALEIDDILLESLEKIYGEIFLYEIAFHADCLYMKYKNANDHIFAYRHSYADEKYEPYIIKIEEDDKMENGTKNYADLKFNNTIIDQRFDKNLNQYYLPPTSDIYTATFTSVSLSCNDCKKTNIKLNKDFVCEICENIKEFDKHNKIK